MDEDGWEARMAERAAIRRMLTEAEQHANEEDIPGVFCGFEVGTSRWQRPGETPRLTINPVTGPTVYLGGAGTYGLDDGDDDTHR